MNLPTYIDSCAHKGRPIDFMFLASERLILLFHCVDGGDSPG